MSKLKRYDIKKLLANPDLRRHLIVESTVVTQAREGIEVTHEQAENSYYVVTEGERAAFFGLAPFRTEPGDSDARHVEYTRALGNRISPVRFDVSLRDFTALEHAPLAFRDLSVVGPLFTNNPSLSAFGEAWQGVISRDDERYFRRHWEVQPRQRGRPWVTLSKGGSFCRFYFDSPLVVDWSSEAQAAFHRLRDTRIYFREGVTWPRRTQRGFSARYLPPTCVFSDKGPTFLPAVPEDTLFILGILNSALVHCLMQSITSFGSWEISALKRMPISPPSSEKKQAIAALSRELLTRKTHWDSGNEVCTRFDRPWMLQKPVNGNAASISPALDKVLTRESALDDELATYYASINDAVYRLYGVNDALRAKIEAAIGERPPEVVWPQMEGKSTEQKRMEHVCRLLSYAVKCVVEEDGDGLVSLQSVAQEPSLLERVRAKLASFFPEEDPHTLEIEIVNELKRRVKGYARTESLHDWLTDVLFDFHCALYQQRPILWHLASSQESAEPAFSVIVHYHRFDHDRLAKLRSVHVRDRLATLRREGAQASKDGREDDRLQLLSALEEVEVFDRKLARLQEGHHEGSEAGDNDYRILTPWKKHEDRPKGWRPDLDDGVRINIAPLARTGLLRTKNKFGAKEPED